MFSWVANAAGSFWLCVDVRGCYDPREQPAPRRTYVELANRVVGLPWLTAVVTTVNRCKTIDLLTVIRLTRQDG